jgi:hypothetical protein
MGTTDIYDDAKNPVITNSLKWKGHDGAIYPYWWEPFLETLSDKKMSVTAAMPLPHYHTISENKSIKIRLKNRLYYIESLDAEFSNKDPYNVICKISLIQIK